MAIFDTIKDAIDKRKVLRAKYTGDDPPLRGFCPHVLGKSSGGERMVLIYQFQGFSKVPINSSRPRKNWRCLRLSGLSNVAVIGGPFRSADNYSAVKQKNIKIVEAKV